MNKQLLNIFSNINEKSKLQYLFLILIVAIAYIIYSPSANYGFISNWDDNINVLNNDYIKSFDSESVKTLFNPHEDIKEPRLVWFTYMIDYNSFKLNPYYYHLHNILWHLLNIILVFILTRLIVKRPINALIVSLLFAIHPMNVEAVVWITGRKDLMYTSFYLLSLFFALKHIKREKLVYFLAVLFFAYLSSLSKIQAITIPLVIIAFELFYRRKFTTISIIEKLLIISIIWLHIWPIYLILSILLYIIIFYTDKLLTKNKLNKYFALIFLLIIAFVSFQLGQFYVITNISIFTLIISYLYQNYIKHKLENRKKKVFILGLLFLIFISLFILISEWNKVSVFYLVKESLSFDRFSFLHRIFMATYSFSFYIIKYFTPVGHSLIQPYPALTNGLLPFYYYLSPFVILAFVFGLRLILQKHILKMSEILFFSSIIIISVLAVLHLLPIHGHLITADRYFYLTSIFITIFIDYIFEKTKIKRQYSQVLLIGFTLFFIVSTSFRLPLWENEKHFFDNVIAKEPNFSLAYNNRGHWHYLQAEIDLAKADFEKAVELDSNNSSAKYNLALILVQNGDFGAALEVISKIEDIETYIDALYLRGYIEYKLSEFEKAIADFDAVLAMAHDHIFAYYNRANSYLKTGNNTSAIADYKTTLNINSKFHQAYDALSTAYFREQRLDSALFFVDQALRLEKNIADYYINKIEYLTTTENVEEICETISDSKHLHNNKLDSLQKLYCNKYSH